ncbi:MAG: helix-turn-helix domain-containing protein [Novosphingobium sp.]|nr:helix-turn-helix domain-containing protein [Novosphingobium sp.]
MSRSSPGVRRVAAILNFIADHPGQAFALTDLVRALKLSRATCHALLTGLVDVGYLYRTSDKTYVLGPALAAIGQTAAKQFSPLQVAKPEMRAIADEYDVVCAAYFLEGDTMHLRDRAASASHVGYPVPLGTRMPLRSAQAAVFFGRSQKDADAWLLRTQPKPSSDSLDRLSRAMSFVAEHGYLIHIRRPGVVLSGALEERFDPTDSDDLPVVPLTEIDEDKVYQVAAMMAPVYDQRDKVSFALLMAGFHNSMTGTMAREAAGRLRNACERVSTFVTGRPDAVPA